MDVSTELIRLSRSSRFHLEAFVFISDGLGYTVEQIHGKTKGESIFPQDPATSSRHVTGRELCLGLRSYALSQYGLMARAVLRSWGIRRCEDFGQIVFELVEAGLLHKNDTDSIRDFENVFDFREAFGPSAVQLTVKA